MDFYLCTVVSVEKRPVTIGVVDLCVCESHKLTNIGIIKKNRHTAYFFQNRHSDYNEVNWFQND